MPEVVGQGDGFAQIFVQAESPAQGPGMLGYFESMREPRSIKIPFHDAENLGLVLQVLEVFAVKNSIASPLETGAIDILLRAVKGSAQSFGALRRIVRKPLFFPFFEPLSRLHFASRSRPQAQA